ncbi:hypothetical protein V757_02180 [Pelistega indica]|uniref:Uncharacterized protein n=1 Tax=Pelistega indica TaxID=1414851 RepID=V8G9Z2_9BURK|nr:hypothetical protein [Pelistega indica]ETD72768.1 hypothetical protein V757_02180 [Pelistega indica]
MSKCISKRKKCEEKETPVPLPPCQEVAFCAGNYTISFDGRCLHKSPRAYQIPNGTYSTVTFEDGCIVGVGQVAPAQYTPNECCASPSVDGSDTSSDVQVSSAPANLLKRTPDG